MSLGKRLASQLRINQRFQMKLIVLTAGFFLAYALVSFLGISFFIGKFSLLGDELGVSDPRLFAGFMRLQQKRLILIQSCSLFILFLGLSLGLVWFSNKVAGPLYRLNEHLKKMSDPNNELREIQFRPKDELKEVEKNFNKLIARVKGN